MAFQTGNDSDAGVFSNDNTSDYFGNSTRTYERPWKAERIARTVFSYFTLSVGTFVNAWFLAAILTSLDLRMRMRNKLLISLQLIHLVDCVMTSCWNLVYEYSKVLPKCMVYQTEISLTMLQAGISNWNLLLLSVIFIANVYDFNPLQACTSKATTMMEVGTLASPWVANIVIVPLVFLLTRLKSSWGCYYVTTDGMIGFMFLTVVVPLSLALMLVVFACVCKRLRFSQAVIGGAMRSALIGGGRELDSSLFYIVIVGVAFCCDFAEELLSTTGWLFELGNVSFKISYRIYLAISMLRDLRVLILPCTYFLLPDVRHRLKTWRPWNRSHPASDMCVTYSKDAQ